MGQHIQWTEKLIFDLVKEYPLHQRTSSYIKRNNPKLHSAIKRRFKNPSFANMMDKGGFDRELSLRAAYTNVNQQPTPKRVGQLESGYNWSHEYVKRYGRKTWSVDVTKEVERAYEIKSMERPILKDNIGFFYIAKSGYAEKLKIISCVICGVECLFTRTNHPKTKQDLCIRCTANKRGIELLPGPPDSLVSKLIKEQSDKHIRTRYGRHKPYSLLYSKMSQFMPAEGLNGGVISLPGTVPHVDLARMLSHFHNITNVWWYEMNPSNMPIVRDAVKDWNLVLGHKTKFKMYPKDVFSGFGNGLGHAYDRGGIRSHKNIGLANIDLECTMTDEILDGCKTIIKKGLVGRGVLGMVLNVATRDRKGMTVTKRADMWRNMIKEFEVLYDSSTQPYHTKFRYNSGVIGCNMSVYGAVLRKKSH
jgi:hypothetical protein